MNANKFTPNILSILSDSLSDWNLGISPTPKFSHRNLSKRKAFNYPVGLRLFFLSIELNILQLEFSIIIGRLDFLKRKSFLPWTGWSGTRETEPIFSWTNWTWTSEHCLLESTGGGNALDDCCPLLPRVWLALHKYTTSISPQTTKNTWRAMFGVLTL